MEERKTFLLNEKYYKSKKAFNFFSNIISDIVNSPCKRIVVNLTEYQYIHPCLAVLLAAMHYIAIEYGKTASILINRRNNKCMTFLDRTGVLAHFQKSQTKSKKTVDFDIITDESQIEDKISSLISKFPVKISESAQDVIKSKLYEVFSNAFTHGGNNKVFCGGTEDSQRRFVFSVYDIGIGIPNNVNRYMTNNLNRPKMSDLDALKWALEMGNSTLNDTVDYIRGAGLDMLEQFIKLNDGEIIMISGEAYCRMTNKGREFATLKYPLLGTFFCMSIMKDNLHRYILQGEKQS